MSNTIPTDRRMNDQQRTPNDCHNQFTNSLIYRTVEKAIKINMHVFKYSSIQRLCWFFEFYFSSGNQQQCDHCTNNKNNIHNILTNGPHSPLQQQQQQQFSFLLTFNSFSHFNICDLYTYSALHFCGHAGVCD